MQVVSSGLFKRWFLFSGTKPETHRLEFTLIGNEEELRQLISDIHLKCVGEIKIPKPQ